MAQIKDKAHPATDMTQKPVKLLLVDDKKENLLSLQVILAGQGYQFVEASSGNEALRILLKTQDFAIILMDVQMPLMDGFETATLIRESEKLRHVPIIFLSANMTTPDNIFKGYESGAVDYMTKPLSGDVLKAKVAIFADLFRKNKDLVEKEQELQILNDSIVTANRKLESQYAEIEQHLSDLQLANKELQAFNYLSSHDLQEPLRKIQTFGTMLQENEAPNLSEKGKQQLQRVCDAAARMRKLINSLLQFSHTSISERKFERIDLNKIVEEVKDALKETLAEKNASIETRDMLPANIIGFQFAQLMQNLISNSLKFSRPDEPARINIQCRRISGMDAAEEKLHPDRHYCHISFSDNGIGFEEDVTEKIFGVFQRLHNRDAYEGTGIGLAIVKKIVDNHNGFIRAKGMPMKGASFDIYIPD